MFKLPFFYSSGPMQGIGWDFDRFVQESIKTLQTRPEFATKVEQWKLFCTELKKTSIFSI